MRLRLENFKHNGAGDVKAIVSLLNDEGNILFQDKVNLCSAASRTRLQRVLSSKYPDMPDIEGTLLEFLNEAANDRRQPISEEAEFSAEEREAGAKFLESPALLDILLEAVNAGGHVGETVNKKALILSVVSTRIKKQKSSISASTKGAPSSGKSVLVNEVISVCPQVWVYSLSRITTNALFYLKGRDLSRRVLFVDEMLGATDSDYGIRLAISEGQLKLLVTNKNAQGQLEAEEVNVPAENMCFISTTTKLSLHQEMETRVIDLYTDESERQTKEVLKAEAGEADSESAQARRRLMQAALYQLQIMDVTIPFASLLSECFPTGKVRARRDFPKLLSLIRASALLHQRQREVVGGKVLASVEDYRVAKEIADVIIAQTLKDLSPQEEQILDVIRAMQDEEVTVRKLYYNVTGITNQRLKNIVGQLREKGFISWNGEHGWKSAYTFVEDPRESLKLPTPEELLNMMHPGVTDVTEMNFAHKPSVEVGNILKSYRNVTELPSRDGDVSNIGNKSVTIANVTEKPSVTHAQKEKSVTSVTGDSKAYIILPSGRYLDWQWCLNTWDKLGRPLVHAGDRDNIFDLSLFLYPEKLSPQRLEGIVDWLEQHSGEKMPG